MTKILVVKIIGEREIGRSFEAIVARQRAMMANQVPGGVTALVCGMCQTPFGCINVQQAQADAEDGIVELCPDCYAQLHQAEEAEEPQVVPGAPASAADLLVIPLPGTTRPDTPRLHILGGNE